MSNKYYAMDTAFFNELGDYSLATRCEMLEEIGFDGSHLTLWTGKEQAWKDAERIAEISAKHNLDLTGIYATLDLDDPAARDRLLKLIPNLPPGCAVEVALECGKNRLLKSSEVGDETALRTLEPLLEMVDPRQNPVCLYAHIGNWLEHHRDALRLIRKINHPSLGWVFSSYHWYAGREGHLQGLLDEGTRSLRRVNLCGSRRKADGAYSLEPLDAGVLDVPVIFGLIVKHGYAGPIGIQGFGIGGDVYTHLQRGLETLRAWNARFRRHPHWCDLLPTPFPWFCTRAPKRRRAQKHGSPGDTPRKSSTLFETVREYPETGQDASTFSREKSVSLPHIWSRASAAKPPRSFSPTGRRCQSSSSIRREFSRSC